MCVCFIFFFWIIQQKNGRKWSTHGGCIRVVVVVYSAKKEAMTSSKLAFAPKPGTSIGTQKDLKHETPAGDDAVQLCFTPTPLFPSLIKRKSYMFFFFFLMLFLEAEPQLPFFPLSTPFLACFSVLCFCFFSYSLHDDISLVDLSV